MKKAHTIYIVTLMILICISAYFDYKYNSTFDRTFINSEIGYDNLLGIKKVDESIVAFYKYKFDNGLEGLGMCIFNKKPFGWEKTGQHAESIYSRVSQNIGFVSHGDITHVIAYGCIDDPEINTLKIIVNGKDNGYANITDTIWKRIWFYEVEQGDLKVEGYNSKGEKVY